MPAPPMRALLGFIAAAISVLIFHQGMWALLHALAVPGLTMPAPYPMERVAPWAFPASPTCASGAACTASCSACCCRGSPRRCGCAGWALASSPPWSDCCWWYFQLIDAPWEARSLATLIANYEAALPPGAWPNWVLGNHDRPRVAAKRGQAQARVAAMLLLTLRGTPTLYYGDELGLSDVAIPSAQVQDPRGLREPGLALGRDPVRTPMPWDGSENAGFTTAKPWLPLNADWPIRNVARMAQEPHSILALYRRLLAARRAHPALAIGDFALLDSEGDVLAYERRHGAERLIVALNLGGHSQRLELPDWASDCRVLLSTVADAALAGDGAVLLRADEGLILMAD